MNAKYLYLHYVLNAEYSTDTLASFTPHVSLCETLYHCGRYKRIPIKQLLSKHPYRVMIHSVVNKRSTDSPSSESRALDSSPDSLPRAEAWVSAWSRRGWERVKPVRDWNAESDAEEGVDGAGVSGALVERDRQASLNIFGRSQKE